MLSWDNSFELVVTWYLEQGSNCQEIPYKVADPMLSAEVGILVRTESMGWEVAG